MTPFLSSLLISVRTVVLSQLLTWFSILRISFAFIAWSADHNISNISSSASETDIFRSIINIGMLILLIRPLTGKYFSRKWNYYIWFLVIIRLLLPIQFTAVLPGGLTFHLHSAERETAGETAMQAAEIEAGEESKEAAGKLTEDVLEGTAGKLPEEVTGEAAGKTTEEAAEEAVGRLPGEAPEEAAGEKAQGKTEG